MLIRYPTPDYTAGVWCYGDETREDSDSEAGPVCQYCDALVDDDGFCRECQEYTA